ncbi:MAG TPA: serine protease, partial [Micromonosporaceae bacterium]|nr:serine protease [Micromonosporaceae bacterium]
MRSLLTRGRRTSAGLLAALLAAGITTLTFGAAGRAETTEPEPGALKTSQAADDNLGAHDLELLAEARANREKTVMLIVATDEGAAPDVAAGLKELGGTVARRVDKVGYVRASVPTDKVERAAAIDGVTAVDLNEVLPMPDPDPRAAGAAGAQAPPVSGPGADTAAVNPYMPTHETGAVAFKRAHPTWDGRGVTIGIMDSGVDLDHPSLQTTSTGERKIVDWFTATDPLFDN